MASLTYEYKVATEYEHWPAKSGRKGNEAPSDCETIELSTPSSPKTEMAFRENENPNKENRRPRP